MSYLSRDLYRHIAWVESLANELQEAARQMAADYNATDLEPDYGWDSEQYSELSQIEPEIDGLGRSIQYALRELQRLHQALLAALL